ncbi:MAG: radical SAM protein [Thermoplasmata archaeon]|nr:radical SAM protein [Thermoplasmata archaeon]
MTSESPEYLRTSLAAAMTMDFKKGRFYRNATSPCVNVLLTYDDGCAGSCAYCGLSSRRHGEYGDKSFIRVDWPTYSWDDMIDSMSKIGNRVKRVCISMVTNGKARSDTSQVILRLKERLDLPVSLLITPTITTKEDLVKYKADGADMVDVAIDCATPELFEKYRGSGVGGPHRWERYWQCLEEAIEVFGKDMAGAHLIVGLGETECQMIEVIQKVRDMGGGTHLFSFFPERDSLLAEHPQPPIGQYRRVQLARFLIDEGICKANNFKFDISGRLNGFGLPEEELDNIIRKGSPFTTSGCAGRDGVVACTRPYANCVPGPEIRNYAFSPEEEDIILIKKQLWS